MKFSRLPNFFTEVDVWGAKAHGRSFIITQTPGIGYTASWDFSAGARIGPAKILGSHLDSFSAAEHLCRDFDRRSLS